jgi:hypothetical protein
MLHIIYFHPEMCCVEWMLDQGIVAVPNIPIVQEMLTLNPRHQRQKPPMHARSPASPLHR